MARPTLDEIFAEPDEYGLLDITQSLRPATGKTDRGLTALRDVVAFVEKTGHLPDANSADHDEMRLGSIWDAVKHAPSPEMLAKDHLGLLVAAPSATARSWREEPSQDEIPNSLDDIFGEDDFDIDPSLSEFKHSKPAAERHIPDHRADFIPCSDFDLFAQRFENVQAALDAGERKAVTVRKWAIIEPLEGDMFIRNGLLALIAEKSETSQRGGARDHRLRVIFSNGTESDPLMSSFRKSLNDDKTARMVEKIGLGPLDPESEADRLELSGTIYVARSLSEDPTIKSQRMILHKIGVTSQDVRRRVADARNDPTFLLAPVEIVATFDLKNHSRRLVEDLLHRFFAGARPAELFVLDRFGKKIHPKEWFYVTPELISQAAKLLQEGSLHQYRYDLTTQAIIKKAV